MMQNKLIANFDFDGKADINNANFVKHLQDYITLLKSLFINKNFSESKKLLSSKVDSEYLISYVAEFFNADYIQLINLIININDNELLEALLGQANHSGTDNLFWISHYDTNQYIKYISDALKNNKILFLTKLINAKHSDGTSALVPVVEKDINSYIYSINYALDIKNFTLLQELTNKKYTDGTDILFAVADKTPVIYLNYIKNSYYYKIKITKWTKSNRIYL